jgi:U3 small nucleolar RNA-associated protein 24
MGKANKTRKFAQVKRMLNPKDARLKINDRSKDIKKNQREKDAGKTEEKVSKLNNVTIKELEKQKVGLFFAHNTQLGPPYHVLLDTNFINFSIQHKLDIFKSLMDVLLAKAIPCVTDCVVAELEKMGHRFRLALKLTKDPRFKRLSCGHKGTYADDCIVDRVKQHRCYLVGTNDKDLKRRLRKVPGVPLISVGNHKYVVERISEDLGGL